jgi:hypothetical protein
MFNREYKDLDREGREAIDAGIRRQKKEWGSSRTVFRLAQNPNKIVYGREMSRIRIT